jgi:HEAT repeat protein
LASRLAPLAVILTLASTLTVAAQQPSPPDVNSFIDRLGNFDYATRTNAARMIRRVPASVAVPALTMAARTHPDQFVRYRALVLLTAFNDRRTADLMRSLYRDRNDRVREVAYRWFAANPETAMAPELLASLQTEEAEFVRPALVAALAAIGSDPQVQRALVAEAGRGFDFFRIAVIEALGERRAAYAVDTIAAAARLDGPIQDDAVLALGRIGGARSIEVLASLKASGPETVASLHAAECLLGKDCEGRVKALVDIATDPRTSSSAARAAITALGAIATKPERLAMTQLAGLGQSSIPGLRDAAAIALSAVAVRAPAATLAWLDAIGEEPARNAAYALLRDGFERLEEDFAEEQFFVVARAAYWQAADGSPARTRIAALIERLEF